MLFASFDFLLFFPPILLGYFALRRSDTAPIAWLLCASYFFYMASPRPTASFVPTPWYFVGLLAFSTVLDFVAGLRIYSQERSWQRNLWLGLSLGVNLGLLGYFKYTRFGLEVVETLLSTAGHEWTAPSLQLLLPIGISFYTFQSLSYTVDVWRGRLQPERSMLRFALYVAFFPQLVAGPIVRAVDFLPQLRTARSVTREDVDFAVHRIFKGLVKKVLLGDFVAAHFADLIFDAPARYSSLENLLALYAFTLQIYADFSGYSDIAIGVARLLGYRLPENFDRPYQSQSVAEFWRRWHMTLSNWLRDYVFFPLGGSRCHPARAYFNLWLTMFLVGMWHGASWNFVIYSNLQAVAMLLGRFFRKPRPVVVAVMVCLLTAGACQVFGTQLLGDELGLHTFALGAVAVSLAAFVPKSGWWTAVHVFLTFHFAVFSRVFFRSPDLERAQETLRKLIDWDGLGIRDGLFSFRPLVDFGSMLSESGAGAIGVFVGAIGQTLIGLVLAVGIAYHFLPKQVVDVPFAALVRKAPGPVLGLMLAVVGALLSQLLNGPRANIYFAF